MEYITIKKSRFGHPRLAPGTYIINNSGYYFDKLVETIDKKHFTIIDNIKKDIHQIILYPKYDEIFENMQKIIDANVILVFYPSQEKEIKLISSYFYEDYVTFEFDKLFFLETTKHIKQHDNTTILKQIFIKLQPKYNFNPSYFYKLYESSGTKFLNEWWKDIEKDIEDYPTLKLAKERSKSKYGFQSCIEPCLYYDLFGKYYNGFLGNSKDLIEFLKDNKTNEKLEEFFNQVDEDFEN
jgi:hypothetical protein